MIDFKEELKKYTPILEIEGVETAIESDEIQDMEDLLQSLYKTIEKE